MSPALTKSGQRRHTALCGFDFDLRTQFDGGLMPTSLEDLPYKDLETGMEADDEYRYDAASRSARYWLTQELERLELKQPYGMTKSLIQSHWLK